jgi:hypothetical protein
MQFPRAVIALVGFLTLAAAVPRRHSPKVDSLQQAMGSRPEYGGCMLTLSIDLWEILLNRSLVRATDGDCLDGYRYADFGNKCEQDFTNSFSSAFPEGMLILLVKGFELCSKSLSLC